MLLLVMCMCFFNGMLSVIIRGQKNNFSGGLKLEPVKT